MDRNTKCKKISHQRNLSATEVKLPKIGSKSLVKGKSSSGLRGTLKKKQANLHLLKEELAELWTQNQVPDSHRMFYLDRLKKTSVKEECSSLQKEITMMKYKNAPILNVMKTVQSREETLSLIKEMIDNIQTEDKKLIRMEASELFKKLRNHSLETVEAIKHWKTSLFSPNAVYKFRDHDYLEKMQNDVQFIMNSSLQKYINFPKNCNTFFNARRKTGNIQMNSRLKAAEEYVFPKKKLKIPKKVEKPQMPSYIFDESPINIIPSDRTPQSKKETSEIDMSYLIERFVESAIEDYFPGLLYECYNEMISASLVLFSSKILEKYLQEVLSTFIPSVAVEAREELNNMEYIYHQSQLLDLLTRAISEETSASASLEVIAEELTEDYSGILPYDVIISETLQEEKAMNEDLVVFIYQDLVDSVLHQEWFTMMVEAQVGDEGLESMWKIMTPYAQHQIWKARTPQIKKKLAWMVYCDILNDIVAGIWLSGIADNLDSEDIDVLMPIPDYEGERKRLKNSIGLGLSLWQFLN